MAGEAGSGSLGRAAVLALAVAPILAGHFASAEEAGFVPLFDGSSLAGWHVSAATSHSAASGNRSGGRWAVVDGAVAGTQDTPGNGGILVSDEAFGDIEVVLEAQIDFGVDSGLFLRSSEAGEAYQVTIDYLPGGSVGGVYGEALSGGIFVKNFEFLETPERIRQIDAPVRLPVAPADWSRFWHAQGWNEIRARIVGNPPVVTSWINGVRFMEFRDGEKRRPDRGAIALQVHGGGDHTGQFARFRNIRVRRLDAAAD